MVARGPTAMMSMAVPRAPIDDAKAAYAQAPKTREVIAQWLADACLARDCLDPGADLPLDVRVKPPDESDDARWDPKQRAAQHGHAGLYLAPPKSSSTV